MYADSGRHDVAQPADRKRCRKFFGFKLQDRDRELLPRLSEEHSALLLTDGNYRELAEKFAIPIGTVRSRLHRARARLELLRRGADVDLSISEP